MPRVCQRKGCGKETKNKFCGKECRQTIRAEELQDKRGRVAASGRCSTCGRGKNLVKRAPTLWIEVELAGQKPRMVGLATAAAAWELALMLAARRLPLPRAMKASFAKGRKPQAVALAPKIEELVSTTASKRSSRRASACAIPGRESPASSIRKPPPSRVKKRKLKLVRPAAAAKR